MSDMTGEEAVAFVQRFAETHPHVVLRAIRQEMQRDPEAAELVRAAIRARIEADAAGVSVEEVIAGWLKPADRWTR